MSKLPAFLVLASFLAALTLSQIWYAFPKPEADVPRHRFMAKLPSSDQLRAVPLSESALDQLATTNCINVDLPATANRPRLTLFLADWNAETAKQMAVVQHTPDICWVGVGWEPVASSYPRTILLTNGEGAQLPFQARLFRNPANHQIEATLWCTLVNGIPYDGDEPAAPAATGTANPKIAQSIAKATMALDQFGRALDSRRRSRGVKQFLRISMPLRHASEPWVERLGQALQDLILFQPFLSQHRVDQANFDNKP